MRAGPRFFRAVFATERMNQTTCGRTQRIVRKQVASDIKLSSAAEMHTHSYGTAQR